MTSRIHRRKSGGTTTEPSPGPVGDESPEQPEEFDVIFETLSNHRRRLVLNYLWSTDQQVDIGTLAEYIAGIENDLPPKQVSSAQRKRAYVGLYQCHLPKMDSYGVVEFNQERGNVSAGPRMREAVGYLGHRSEGESVIGCSRAFGIGVSAIVVALITFVATTSVQLLPTVGMLVIAGAGASALLGGGIVFTNELT